jgi:hypothetical protein
MLRFLNINHTVLRLPNQRNKRMLIRLRRKINLRSSNILLGARLRASIRHGNTKPFNPQQLGRFIANGNRRVDVVEVKAHVSVLEQRGKVDEHEIAAGFFLVPDAEGFHGAHLFATVDHAGESFVGADGFFRLEGSY